MSVKDRVRQLVAGVAVVGAAAGASAQPAAHPVEVSVGTGWAALWDDETNLGRGAPLAGGVATTLGGRLRVGADVDWVRHIRDSGYLRAEGDLAEVFGRASWWFGHPRSTVRAVAGAGFGLLRSSGVLIGRSVVAGPGGLPVTGPDTRAPWRLTTGAYEWHGGVRVRVRDRVAVRPEIRWRIGAAHGSRSGIEPPLLGIQWLAHVDFRL